MATKFYFHAAASGVGGTLPSTEQSSLTSTIDVDAQTVNRSMNTTIGTAQQTVSRVGNMATSSRNYYFTKFVSPPIYQTSIAANTWTYAFSASESTVQANFPVPGSSQPVRVNCYVWRPSDGTKVGTILDGNTASDVSEGGTGEEVYHITTFTGSSVAGVQNGDVIILEVWFVFASTVTSSLTIGFHYDGTTEYANDTTSTSEPPISVLLRT